MTTALLKDAFEHHVWATLRVIDACLALRPGQVQTVVPGTYGSILDTLRHLVGADANYLFVLSGGQAPLLTDRELDLEQLRAEMERHGTAWTALLDNELDPAAMVVRRRDDGSTTTAPVGIRIAQVLHHGTDHRSQICTALTSLGVEPPAIDVWDFAEQDGRLIDTPPTA